MYIVIFIVIDFFPAPNNRCSLDRVIFFPRTRTRYRDRFDGALPDASVRGARVGRARLSPDVRCTRSNARKNTTINTLTRTSNTSNVYDDNDNETVHDSIVANNIVTNIYRRGDVDFAPAIGVRFRSERARNATDNRDDSLTLVGDFRKMVFI